MKKLTIIIACLISVQCFAQGTNKGVQWAHGLTLEQAKAKAKKENKYVFVDCYTTWCGPCKMMDADVFSQESVGSYFNQQFIAVKVQMDKTASDDAEVKNLYTTADAIAKSYRIEGYPTFLIFSPDGTLSEKYTGASMDVQKFIGQMQAAVVPGKVYKDPYQEYYQLVEEFKNGKVYYDRIPAMVSTAKQLGENDMVRALVKAHTEYVSRLSANDRFTETNIKFWSSLNLGSKSVLLRYFIKDEKKINRVMKSDSYSATQVDKCIQNFIVPVFFATQKLPKGVSMQGMQVMETATDAKKTAVPSVEADWRKLYDTLKTEFSTTAVKRNVLLAKITWYDRLKNTKSMMAALTERYAKYPSDFSTEALLVNSMCWNVFSQDSDQQVLSQAADVMGKLVETRIKLNGSAGAPYMDTYANLLYKTGKKTEAIQWEEKAAAKSPSFVQTLDNMKHNWPSTAANWDGNPFVTWNGYKFAVYVNVSSPENKPLENITVQNATTGEISTTKASGYAKINVCVGDKLNVKNTSSSKEVAIAAFTGVVKVTL